MCKEEINECLEEGYPCQNSGACVDLIGIYECLCVEGFTGSLCQTNIDECEDVECENNGTCIDMVNGFRCECHGNYTGSYCESEISFVTFGIDINATTSVSNISALETSTTEPFTTDSSIHLATDDATNYTSKPSTQNPSKTTTESTPSENISFAGTLQTTPTTDSSVSSILDTISTIEREISDVLNTSTTTTAVPASTILSNTTLMKDLSVINASSATSLQTKFKQSDEISSYALTKSSSSASILDSIHVSTSSTRTSSSFSLTSSVPSTNETLKQVMTVTVSKQSTMTTTTTAIPKNFTSLSTSTSKTQSNATEPQTDFMTSSGDVESEDLKEQYIFLSDTSTVKDEISIGDIATDAETTHDFYSGTTESIGVFTESESFSGDTMTSSEEIKVLSDLQNEKESSGDNVTASGDMLPTAQSAIDVDILPETFSDDIMTSSGETKYLTALESEKSSEESSGEDMTTSGDMPPTTQSAIEVDILPEGETFSGDIITLTGETELLPDIESETYSWDSSGEDVTASGEMIRTTQIDILNESKIFSGDIITPSVETNVLADLESDTYSVESSDEDMTASGDILPTTQRARGVEILPESETFSGDIIVSSSETKVLADIETGTSSGESSGEDVAASGDMLPITRSTTEVGILTEREPFSGDIITSSGESKVFLEKEASSGESSGEELSFSGDKMVSRKDFDIISSGDLNVVEQDIEVMSGDGFVRYEDISSGYYQIERVGVTESSRESYDTISEETLSSGDIATTSSALHGITSAGYVSGSVYSHNDTSSGATTVDSVYSADVIPFTLPPDLETLESSGEPDSSLLEQEGFISYREASSTSLYLKSSMTTSSPVSQTTFSEYVSSPRDSVASDTFQSPETISSGAEPIEEAIISSGVDSSDDKDYSSGQIVSEEAHFSSGDMFSSGDIVSKEVWVSSGDLPSSDIPHSLGDILSEDTSIFSGDVMSGDMLPSLRHETTFRPGDIFTEETTLSSAGRIYEDTWLSSGDIMSGDITLGMPEDVSVSSGEFVSRDMLVSSGDILPNDTSVSSDDMPLVDELASSGDVISGDILQSSGDSLAEGTLSSGDRSAEGAWLSSGDTISGDILQSSGDSLSEDANISSGDMMTQDELLSSGQISSDDRALSSSGDTLYEDTWLSSGHTLSEDTTISSRDRLQTDETVVSFSGNKPEEPTISSEVGYTEGNVSISEPFLTTDAQLSFAYHTSRGKTREVFPQKRLLGSTTKPSSTTSTTIRTRDPNWVETNGTVTGDSQMKVINYTEFNIASIDDDDIMALKDVSQFETSKTTGQTNQTTERTKTYVTSENTTETPERKLADKMFYQTFTTKFEHTSMVSPSQHNKTQHLLDTSSTSATNNKGVTTTEKSMIDTVDKTTVSTDKSQTEKQTYANNITAGKGLQQGASLSTYTTQKLTLATTANNTQTTHITQVGITKQMKSDVFRPINPWLLASRHLQKIKLREQISRPNITTAIPLHANTTIKETHAMSKHSYFTVQTQKHSTQTTSDAHITTETDLADLEEYTTVDKTVVSDTGFTTDLIVTRGVPSSENMKGASNVNLETETVIDAHLSTDASITTDWSTSEAATDKAKESFENRTISYINVTSDVNATRAVPSVVPDHTDTSTKMVTISYTDTTSVTSESKHSNLTLIDETMIPSQGETSTVMHESVSKVLRTLTVDSSNLQQTTDFPQEKSTIIYSPSMKTDKLELTTFSNKSETATQSSESTIGIPGVTTESLSETDSTDMTPEHYTTYKPRNETVTHTTRMIPSPPPMITETPPYFPRANVSDLTDTTSLLFPTLTAAVSTASTEQSATPVIQNLTTLTIPTPTTRMIPSPPPMVTEPPPYFPLGNMSDLNDTSSFPIPTLTPAVSTASSKQSTTPFLQNLTSLPIPTPTTRMIPSPPPVITESPPYFPLGNMSDLNDTSSFPISKLTPAVSTASSKQSTTPFIQNLTSLPIHTPTTRMIPSPPPMIKEPPPYFPLGNMSDLNDTSSFPIPTLTPAVSTASTEQSTMPFIQNLSSLAVPTPTTHMIPSPPPIITEPPPYFPLGNMSDLNDTSSFPLHTLTPAVSTASTEQSAMPFIQNLTSLHIPTPTTRMIPSPPPMITEPPPYFPPGNISDLNDTSSFPIPTLTPAVSTAFTEQSTTPFIQSLTSLPISTPPQVASSSASTTPIVQPTISSSGIASVSTSTTVQSTTHSTDKLTKPASLAISSVNTMSLNNVTQTLTSSLTTNVLCKKQLKWSRLKVCVKIANDSRTIFQPEMADLKFSTGSESNVSSSTIKTSSPPDVSTSFTMPGVITSLTSEARKESFEPQKQITTSLKPTIHVPESPSTSIQHDFKTTVAGKDSACAIVEYFGRFKICYKFPLTTTSLGEISTVSSLFSPKTISTITIYDKNPTSKSTTNTTTSTLSSTTQTPQYTPETPQYTSASTAIPYIMKTSSQTPSSLTSSTPLKMMSSEKLTFTTPTSAFSNQSISAQASSVASTKSDATTLSAVSTLPSKPTSTTKLTSTSATFKYSPTNPTDVPAPTITSTLDSSPSSFNRTETSEISSTQVNTSTASSTATSTIPTHKPTPQIFTPPSTSKQTSSSTTNSTVLTSISDSTTKGIFTQTTSPSIQTSTTSPSTHQPSSTSAMPTSKPSTRTSTNYLVTETANVVSVSTSMPSSTMQPITTSFSFSSTLSGAKLSSSSSTETQTSTSESVSKPSPAILSYLLPVTTESNISQVTVSFSKPHSPESFSTKSSFTTTSATTSTEPTYKTTEALHKTETLTETLTSKSSTKRTTAGPIFDTATLSSTPFSTHSVPASSSSVVTPKPQPYSRTPFDIKSTPTQTTEPSSTTQQTMASTIKQEKEHGILIKVLTKHISTTETTIPPSGTTPSEEILYPTHTKKLSVIRHIIDLTSNNTFPKPRKEISEYIRNETVVKKKAILTFKMIKVTVVRTVSDVVDTGRRVVLQSYRRAKDIATKLTVTTYNRAKKLLKQALHRVEALWQYCKTGINHFIVKPLLNARVYVKHRFVKAYSRLGEIFERGKLILNTTVDTVREETSSYFEDLANYYSGVYRQYTSEVKDIFDSLKIPENS